MSYFITHSGEIVNPANISTLNIKLDDIAHHLAKIQRYGGCLPLNANYSVAQHSILMAFHAAEFYDLDTARACMLHDASEAYLGDVVSGLKKYLPDYTKIESTLTQMIEDKYLINSSKYAIVEELDKRIVLNEVKFFFPARYDLFQALAKGLDPLPDVNIELYSESQVYYTFVKLCERLDIYD